jgi:hypothetical protein
MAQHISMFHNETNNGAFTAKAKSKQDYYFIGRGQALKPDQEVLIEKGSWTSFDTALPETNFIFTGNIAYCFWDTGSSQIAGVASNNPHQVLMLADKANAGKFNLTINPNGSIRFV